MKKKLFILLFPLLSFGQTQIGDAIYGKTANENFGQNISLSKNGDILAVRGPEANINGQKMSEIQVYKNTARTWITTRNPIYEKSDRNATISLSKDGSAIAIAENLDIFNPRTNLKELCYLVSVFNTNDNRGPAEIIFTEAQVPSNYTQNISLSEDGSVLAVANGAGAAVFRKIGRHFWPQIGNRINFADNVSLSRDGNTLATGSSFGASDAKGVVKILSNIGGNWQRQMDFFGKENEGLGYKVLLSGDGTTVAAVGWNGIVRVYRNAGGNWNWVQLGTDIEHKSSSRNTIDVSLSDDGTILAIGNPHNDQVKSGRVMIYKYAAGVWTQIGKNIDGEQDDDGNGQSISLSGDGLTLAISAPWNDTNGKDSGKVSVYDLSSLFSPLSTDQFLNTTAVVYPNPASQPVTIDLQENVQLKGITIYDALGKLIKTTEKNVIDMSPLPNGNYFFEIVTDKGKTTKTIVKK
ncbi:T9SS type A sorting domain-containing protein [Flavobacterium poyangense]|uniref:T9SS type A sorting domain-containing protein n=1 Tax=Flavobacterium poyangense TaxID=2204302 RepID=UPI00141F3C93|nr:T9SS type A sorting domain-containing protein [Flavobacterium sp. JXAS1]